MSDLVATALGLGFALLVCLLAVQAILSPWLRVRRTQKPTTPGLQEPKALHHTPTPDTTAAH